MGRLIRLGHELESPPIPIVMSEPDPTIGPKVLQQKIAEIQAAQKNLAAQDPLTRWLEQEMISGVPNKWLLGGSAGVLFLLTVLRRRRR